jgi:hypothetical protein
MDVKPKRVLTEAQRLAFLKGREKRMANIEKKRLEKLEADQMELPAAPPKPAPKPRASKKHIVAVQADPDISNEPNPEPEKKPEPEPVTETKEEIPPEKPVLTRQTNDHTVIQIDEDKIASRVAEEVLRKIEQSKKPRKPRTPRPPPAVVPDEDPDSDPAPTARPRVVHNFSWL